MFTSALDVLQGKIQSRLHALANECDGVLGVTAIDLVSGDLLFAVNAEVSFAVASVIKIAIMAALFHARADGDCSLEEEHIITASDIVGGSGALGKPSQELPVTLTLGELIRLMIQESDNTATNRCISVFGLAKMNAIITSGLGLTQTRVQRVMFDTTGAAERDAENISTPLEMARLLQRMHRRELRGSDEMLALLGLVACNAGLQLPSGGFRGVVSATKPLASKAGQIPGVGAEAGIVLLPRHPFVIVVMGCFLPVGHETVSVSRAADIVCEDYFFKAETSNSYGATLPLRGGGGGGGDGRP